MKCRSFLFFRRKEQIEINLKLFQVYSLSSVSLQVKYINTILVLTFEYNIEYSIQCHNIRGNLKRNCRS